MRTLQIGRALQRFGTVKLVIAAYADCDKQTLDLISKEFDVEMITKVVSSPISSLAERLEHEFDSSCMNTSGHLVEPASLNQFNKLVEETDVVWVHTLTVANFFRRWKWPKSVIDVDDFLSSYHFESYKTSVSYRDRLMSLRKYWLWKRRESRLLDRFSVVSVCSQQDRNNVVDSARVQVVANGYPDYWQPANSQELRLGIVGKMDYGPNRDGVEWFLKEVWPQILRSIPKAEFRIVGTGCPQSWCESPRVKVLGYVEDTRDEIASWMCTVVPILVGGGTRVKIAEAFSRGCPVVSTHVGAFGYAVKNGRELLLADDAKNFAQACEKLLSDSNLRNNLRSAARRYYEMNLTWDAIAESVKRALDQAASL